MLTFFPTPYPDEWWYSVLCRYYVRSGWAKTSSVLHELYGNRRISHGTLFPSIDCYETIHNLPSNIFDLKKILLDHTLMPYYLRFYPVERKESILSDFLSGINTSISKIRINVPKDKQGLKFCPACYAEDVKSYEEPYWHREHQIPLMPVCPRHKTKLYSVEIPLHRLTESFLPLCKIKNTVSAVHSDECCCAWEQSLSEALFSILTLPFEVGPPQGYSNLKNALVSMGFSKRITCDSKFLDAEKLYQSCIESFGEDICRDYFENITQGTLYRICEWKSVLPEQYALLSVFAGLPVQDLFGSEIQSMDPILKHMLAYKSKGIIYKKEDLARLIGVDPIHLNTLARKYHITPFWTQRNENRIEMLHLCLTAEEKQKILTAASAYGNGPVSAFARTILLQEARKILEEQKEEEAK